MSEKELEDALASTLREASGSPERLAAIRFTGTEFGEQSFADLCGSNAFEVFQNDVAWNTHKNFMGEVIGGMTPDIVLRSVQSGQNRIYVEVKESACLGYDTEDSQIIRYFLHLLAVSTRGEGDIRRAIIVAAPSRWFSDTRTGTDWWYFVDRYSDLAKKFKVTIGELRVDIQLAVAADRDG